MFQVGLYADLCVLSSMWGQSKAPCWSNVRKVLIKTEVVYVHSEPEGSLSLRVCYIIVSKNNVCQDGVKQVNELEFSWFLFKYTEIQRSLLEVISSVLLMQSGVIVLVCSQYFIKHNYIFLSWNS